MAAAPESRPLFLRTLGWLISVGLILAAGGVVVRGCGGEAGPLLRYLGYLAAWVVLPGYVVLHWWIKRRPTLLEVLGVAIPLGFAAEILSWIGASAAGLRFAIWVTPVVWALAAWIQARREPIKFEVAKNWTAPGAVSIALVAAGVALIISAAAWQYVPSPLLNGAPSHRSHHDWIYLLGRAAELKHHWPPGNPSLPGAPIAYHYFLLVHLASASVVTGDELSVLFFRLSIIPLSVSVTAQLFQLGRRLDGSAITGILAVLLAVFAAEVSTVGGSAATGFGQLFVPFLFLSPTFFFGIVYLGCLLWVVPEVLRAPRFRPVDAVLLSGLAIVATGAKATIVPPLVLVAGAWIAVAWWRRRAEAIRMILVGLCLGLGFSAFYFPVMIGTWGTGDTVFAFRPTVSLTTFWRTHVDSWTQRITPLLPEAGGSPLARVGLAMAVIAGYSGVRLLGWWYLARQRLHQARVEVWWIGGALLVQYAIPQWITFDSNGQLYVVAASVFPEAVLAAAGLTAVWTHWKRVKAALPAATAREADWLLRLGLLAAVVMLWQWAHLGGPLAFGLGALVISWKPTGRSGATGNISAAEATAIHRANTWPLVLAGLIGVLGVLAFQVNHARLRVEPNLKRWWSGPVGKTLSLQAVVDGMRWVRATTPADTVLLPNTMTSDHISRAHIRAVDGVTLDKYYFYSALAERRVWVEGPTYLRERLEVLARLDAAAAFFATGAVGDALPSSSTDVLLVIDLSLPPPHPNALRDARLIFANERLQIFEWSRVERTAHGGSN